MKNFSLQRGLARMFPRTPLRLSTGLLLRFKKISYEEEIGRNVRAHSLRFPRTRFFACQPKDAHQNLGRVTRTRRVVRRVREARTTARTKKSVRVATALVNPDSQTSDVVAGWLAVQSVSPTYTHLFIPRCWRRRSQQKSTREHRPWLRSRPDWGLTCRLRQTVDDLISR